MTDVLVRRWSEPAPPPVLPPSPWLIGDVMGVAVVNLVGLGMILGGTQGARHATDPHTLLLLVNIASAGLVVALAGNAVFLLSTLRHVGQLRTELLGQRQALVAHAVEAVSVHEGLVAAVNMTRFHLASCPAAQGKDVTQATLAEHRSASRLPCGLCNPESERVQQWTS